MKYCDEVAFRALYTNVSKIDKIKEKLEVEEWDAWWR